MWDVGGQDKVYINEYVAPADALILVSLLAGEIVQLIVPAVDSAAQCARRCQRQLASLNVKYLLACALPGVSIRYFADPAALEALLPEYAGSHLRGR